MSSLPVSVPSHFLKLPETRNLVLREGNSYRHFPIIYLYRQEKQKSLSEDS
jgi:hypothetical protein